MTKIHLVYTPNADEFQMNYLERVSETIFPNNFRLPARLRPNYLELGREIELPSKVGVITTNHIVKKLAKRDYPREYLKSSYYPLDIMELVLNALEENSIGNLMAQEAQYRQIGYWLDHPSFTRDARTQYREMVALQSCVPFVEEAKRQAVSPDADEESIRRAISHSVDKLAHEKRRLGQDVEQLYFELNPHNLNVPLDRILARLDLYASPDKFEELYALIKNEFDLNGVARDFPLHYHPNNTNTLLEFAIVDLGAKVVRGHSYDQNSIDAIEHEEDIGEAMQGASKLYARSFDIDHFGITRLADSVQKLYDSLPHPRTLITDTYLAHLIPDLFSFKPKMTTFKLDS